LFLVASIRRIAKIKTVVLYRCKILVLRTLAKICLPITRRNDVEHVTNGPSINGHGKFAVVALFPSEDPIYIVSIKNLIDGFIINHVKVVVILNRDAGEDLMEFFNRNDCVIIKRKNRGRDFGAYKAGFLWLDCKIGVSKIDRLVLVNDTLLWMSNSSEVVSKTLEDDWSCLYLNLERDSHAQSFYLSFSNKILENKKFLSFWNSYVPTKSRRDAINLGEIKVSEVLLKEGFRCKPYINPSLMNSIALGGIPQPLLTFELGRLAISQEGGIVQPGVLPGRRNPLDEVKQYFGINELVNNLELEESQLAVNLIRMLSRYCYSQAPHRIGLHLYLMLGMPLKADIFKCYELSEIFRCLQLRNPEVSDLALDYYSSRCQKFMEGSRKNKRLRMLGEI
jgi:hypothetical protein